MIMKSNILLSTHLGDFQFTVNEVMSYKCNLMCTLGVVSEICYVPNDSPHRDRILCESTVKRGPKGYWKPKRKLAVTTHFWEIIKLQFGKTFHTLSQRFFWNFSCVIVSEKCEVTHNFLFRFQLPLLTSLLSSVLRFIFFKIVQKMSL